MDLFFQIIQNFLSVYNIVIIVYILSSWLPGLRATPIMRVLAGLVEPYFALFRRLPFAQLGYVSLAPLYGLLFLNLLEVMILRMQQFGQVTVGFMLSFLVNGIWSVFSFVLGLFAILAGIRLFFGLILPRMSNMFTQVLDMLITMSVAMVAAIFSRNRVIDYRLALTLVVLLNTAILLVASPLVSILSGLLSNLPI
ncbi:MAG: YggT family protein [Spirochaetia bacterium]